MSAYTPGPWTFELDDDGITDVMAVVFVKDRKPGRAEIAQIEAQPQVQANARLIAAAPDLLAALKRIMEYDAGPLHSGSRDGYEWIGRSGNVWEAARAAIAKAEGR